jgi:hypothetical protein
LLEYWQAAEKARFVSGHRFSDAVSVTELVAPSGAAVRNMTFIAACQELQIPRFARDDNQPGTAPAMWSKNLGDAFRVPVCLLWLKALSVSSLRPSLLSSWLPLIYSPFPFFMDLKCNGRLLQLIDV